MTKWCCGASESRPGALGTTLIPPKKKPGLASIPRYTIDVQFVFATRRVASPSAPNAAAAFLPRKAPNPLIIIMIIIMIMIINSNLMLLI